MDPNESIRARKARAIGRAAGPGGIRLWRLRPGRLARPASALAVAAALVLGAAGASAGGAIYKYVDEQGVVHFTNVQPTDDRYRPVRYQPETRPARGAPPAAVRFDGLIDLSARRHSLSPALVKAVVAAESNFDPEAVSHKGALGLMQLMPGTARALGVSDPLRPEENVLGGTRYLRQLLDRFGRLDHALAAYNAGPTAVDRYGGIPPYRETRDYVSRVLTYYRHYNDQLGR